MLNRNVAGNDVAFGGVVVAETDGEHVARAGSAIVRHVDGEIDGLVWPSAGGTSQVSLVSGNR